MTRLTRYLLDRDVVAQLECPEADRDAHARAWLRSVPDHALHVSAITVMEAWRGLRVARAGAQDAPDAIELCDSVERGLEILLAAFDGRILAIDATVARVWGPMRPTSDADDRDHALAATAIAHGLVIASGTPTTFTARGARALDPFQSRRVIAGPAKPARSPPRLIAAG